MIGVIAVLALLKILGSLDSSQPAAAHRTDAARPGDGRHFPVHGM